jgi:hypothetical protein
MTDTLKPPIILIGNYRSGTSITQKLIGLHPDIVTWYEPRTLWLYADPRRPHDEFDETDASEKVVRYIRGRFLSYQKRHGNRRIMEKTPGNILRVPYVRAIFPEATLLHITRNPFSYLSSMEFKWQRTKTLRGILRSLQDTPITQLPYYLEQFANDMVRKKLLKTKYVSIYGPRYRGIYEDMKTASKLKVIARQWAIGNRMAREDLGSLGQGRVLSLRYEDLVATPQACFREIYDFCGLQYDAGMLSTAEKMVDPGRQERWRRFDRQQLDAIMPEIEGEMEFYGYKIPQSLL